MSSSTSNVAKQHKFTLAPNTAPRIALLLYRKHVITGQRYIQDLITYFESEGFIPIPVFINGVEGTYCDMSFVKHLIICAKPHCANFRIICLPLLSTYHRERLVNFTT
mgnify:CR=1 FL=1